MFPKELMDSWIHNFTTILTHLQVTTSETLWRSWLLESNHGCLADYLKTPTYCRLQCQLCPAPLLWFECASNVLLKTITEPLQCPCAPAAIRCLRPKSVEHCHVLACADMCRHVLSCAGECAGGNAAGVPHRAHPCADHRPRKVGDRCISVPTRCAAQCGRQVRVHPTIGLFVTNASAAMPAAGNDE